MSPVNGGVVLPQGLRVILSVRPGTLSTMLPRLLKPPMSVADLTALGSLSEVAGADASCAIPVCTALGMSA